MMQEIPKTKKGSCSLQSIRINGDKRIQAANVTEGSMNPEVRE